MNVGIHFSNHQWNAPAEEAYRRLALCRPPLIKTCVHGQCGFDQVAVHRRLRKEHPKAQIIGRLMGNGFALEDYWEQIEALRRYVDGFEIGNEPNHPAEWSKGMAAWLAWFDATLSQYRAWFPAVSWVFPGMAVNGTAEAWWAACSDAMSRCDYAGVHCYWQYENIAHPAFGRTWEALRRYTDRPQIVTEVGDSTPGRSAIDKAARIITWARDLPAYVVGSAVYIVGGTPDWAEFELDAGACAMLGAAQTEATVSTPTVDGFDFPCGAPNGGGYYVAAGLCDEAYYRDRKAWHTGEDWNGTGGGDTDEGHPVYAVAHGRVEAAGSWAGWGNIVLIEHRLPEGRQVWSQYAHLGEMHVRLDDVVRRGQQIGTIGHMRDANGNATGPAHLHFELRAQYLKPDAWGWSREDVLRYYLYPREYIATHRPGTAHLPEGEPATTPPDIGDKATWWTEEAIRRLEAGDTARALEILHSLVKLQSRLRTAKG